MNLNQEKRLIYNNDLNFDRNGNEPSAGTAGLRLFMVTTVPKRSNI